MIKRKNSLILVLTILFSMVFAINLGYTFCQSVVDYSLNVSGHTSDGTKETYSYLNDVVINNSTTLVPIPFTIGTVAREISFDYSFSEDTDYAVEYSLKYVDNSGNDTGTEVDNVQINFCDRDNYLIDTPKVESLLSVNQFDNLSPTGTMFYLGYIPAGTGNKKLINSVTFISQNSEITSYQAVSNVTLYNTSYQVGDEFTITEFEYVKDNIRRYWQQNADGTYSTIQNYTIAGSSVSKSNVSLSEFQNAISTCENYFGVTYICNADVTINSTNYTKGSYITETAYNTLVNANEDNAQYFNKIYRCTSAFSIVGANAKTISSGSNITAEEFANLYTLEKNYFKASGYKGYEGVNLVIEIKVHTKLNFSAINSASSTETVTEYYSEDHYFKNYAVSEDDEIFNIWLAFKQKNTATSGAVTVPSQQLLIYNSHGDFESGISYAYDFSANENIQSTAKNSNITTTYIYSQDGNFYALAGGNKNHAGVGIYYMTDTQAGLRVSVGVTWYDANGQRLSTMTTISNVEVGYNSNFTADVNNYYKYDKYLLANSYGYIDVLDYIRTTTIWEQTSLIGTKLVITSVSAEFTAASGATSHSGTGIKVINTTSSNAVLFTSVANIGYTSTLDFNVSLVNETDSPLNVTSFTVTPKFYAYNGQTSQSLLKTNTVYLQFGNASSTGTRFIYNNSTWTMNSGTHNNDGSYTYTFSSNGIYIAPRTSLTVIDGAVVVAPSTGWDFELIDGSGVTYSADYWFEVATSNVVSSTASTNKTTTTNYELMTILTDNSLERGNTTYIAMRNNTSQIMNNVTFSATLANEANITNSISYTYYNYATNPNTANSGTRSTTISITFSGINLLPGESIILCKIVASSSSAYNFKLNEYSISATLGSTPSVSGTTYLRRDFASGNLSICNQKTSDIDFTIAINQIGSNTAITSPTLLNGGTDKWTYASRFSYNGTLRVGQLLNVINGYYSANLTATITEV